MVFVGRIFEIVEITEQVAQIVFKKKDGDRFVYWHFCVFGFWKDRALMKQELKPRMKIKANVHMNSKKDNQKNKWWGDFFFKEIYIIEEGTDALKDRGRLFKSDAGTVDASAGEVVEKENE